MMIPYSNLFKMANFYWSFNIIPKLLSSLVMTRGLVPISIAEIMLILKCSSRFYLTVGIYICLFLFRTTHHARHDSECPWQPWEPQSEGPVVVQKSDRVGSQQACSLSCHWPTHRGSCTGLQMEPGHMSSSEPEECSESDVLVWSWSAQEGVCWIRCSLCVTI